MTVNEKQTDEGGSEELTRVASTDDVGVGERRLVEVGGREIAVFNVNGEYHALANYCVHQGGPICEGKVSGAVLEEDGELIWDREDEFVSCPWHGWEFEIESGEHITNKKYRLPQYEVVVRDGTIYLDL
ncbi:Rieske (2Fe-2S) iron-sulfur domain-containing protein (plasmid) [halophilic archaeon DL31]|nr:Rieske (2Fe-2S) iron-sulfur domain-containing protein [halophilic archaeon DL31]